MPGFNQTGPNGQGPMTGRGLGQCNDANAQPVYGRGRGFFGCGRGRSFGRGRGYGLGYTYQVDPKTELEALKREKEALENAIKNLESNNNEE